MYEYKVLQVLRVVDGDTVDLELDLGFHLTAALRFRLVGVNTPEIFHDPVPDGFTAKQITEEWLQARAGLLTVRTTKTDAFGRWLAEIIAPDGTLNGELVKRGWIYKK